MIITFDWLKDHLKTNLKEKNLLEQLTNIGLEVESVESLSADNELFKIAEIIKTEKHPNADRLKVCDINIGEKEIKKVVCGAENAKEGLLTIYAPPGAIIPKTMVLGIIAPGGAYIVSNPSFAFSAPHTTFLISFSPIFISQTFSRSAFGCFSVFMISAILNNSLSAERLSTLSTSRPMLVSCSKRFFSFRFVFR